MADKKPSKKTSQQKNKRGGKNASNRHSHTQQGRSHPNNKKDGNPRKSITGTLFINTRGTGYVTAEGFNEDIEIINEDLNTARHDDTVEITLLPKQKNQRQRGEVKRVIEHAKTQFVGTIEKSDGITYVVPDDKRMYRNILLRGEDTEKAPSGHKVIAAITSWDNPHNPPEGSLVDILGTAGEHDVEMKSIVIENGFDLDFPETVQQEAEQIASQALPIPENVIAERRDFRNVPTFTIDPEDAKDFDDALSLRELGDGRYEVGIHIADVSHYVTEGTDLDREARKRGFSVYLVDRTIPMLPLELSTDVCSLNPEVERLAFSAVFTMDTNGTVHDEWFGKSVIRSNRRFAYEEAQDTLNAQSGEHYTELSVLDTIAQALREEKFKEGAIDFETEEIEFVLADDGTPIKVYKKERLETHKLIEEFMLLANRRVATFMFRAHNKSDKQSKPGRSAHGQRDTFIYRIHDIPDPEKMQDLSIFLKALGYDQVDLSRKQVSSQDINKILRAVEGSPEESLIKTAAIRSMSKATYSTKNIGHFGLAFQYYTHFTSPIRRYADLMVHRMLYRHLTGNHISSEEMQKYEALSAATTEKEIAAAVAERDSIKYKQVEYMQEHVGETFDATISGVVEYGIYVQENKTHAEGLVHISNLGEDYFEFDEKAYALVGKDSDKRFTLGDDVRVKLTDTDIEKKQLSFELSD